MTGSPRTLILLRHAKSAWPEGVPDVRRPLAARGRRDGPAVGRWLRQQAPPIDLVVCSPAVRAFQTWELVAPYVDGDPLLRYDERLYGSPAEVFLTVTRELPPDAATVLLVGHNPSLEHFLSLLTGVAQRFRTSTTAVVTTSVGWPAAHPGSWTLEALATPRDESGE